MRWLERFSRTGMVLAGLCATLAAVCVVWLVRADDRLLDQIPKRQAQGKELRLEHHMALGFRRAAWAGLVVGLVGAATSGWWGRRDEGGGSSRSAGAEGVDEERTKWGVLPVGCLQPVPWRTVAAVAVVAMAVSGALRWPRLGHSFWSDEAYAARAYVWGVKVPQPGGGLDFKPVTWTEALFLNERANNQIWCSIEARVSHGIWLKTTGASPDTFSENVLRLPAFLWGLGTVAAVTVLGAMLAGKSGTAAGLLLAVHPWHVRFAAEMRGYSAMLLALALGTIFLLLALRSGRWRWWLLQAATTLWALLAFAGSVYVPLVGGAVAAGWLAWRRRWDWLARLLIANALAGVVFLWTYGPSITQLKAYLGRGTDAGAYIVSATWLKQFGESLCLGVPWSVMSRTWQEAHWLPTASAAAAAVATIAVLAGLRGVLTVRFQPRLLVIPAALLAAGLLAIGQSVAAGTLLLMWYLLPVVIGWVILMGTGPEPEAMASGRGARAILAGVEIVTVAVCLMVWTGTSMAMAAVPRQPMREAALVDRDPQPVSWWLRLCTGFGGGPAAPIFATTPAGPPARPDVHAVIGISDGQMKLYAPNVITVKSLADLEKVEAQAAAAGTKLWISVGGWEASRERAPEVVARLESGAYEKVGDLPGWEPMFSYQVWRQR